MGENQAESRVETGPAPRARDLGLPLAGEPGLLNAISDVPGVEVGQYSLIAEPGVRTGVTVILPRGRAQAISVLPAGGFALNGNGELTGMAWIAEAGRLEGPIALTNTCSLGMTRDALRRWMVERTGGGELGPGLLPVVGETWDGLLNDIEAQQLRPEHVFAALDAAAPGPVAEGGVGGGTGMVAFELKAGIGTASRRLRLSAGDYTLGVLVQANFGLREQLTICGRPVGAQLAQLEPRLFRPQSARDGSIIGILATDAPLLPIQLQRLARRMALGLARTGGIAHNSSGDLFLAFSTAAPETGKDGLEHWRTLPDSGLDPLFAAAVQATEESIYNALCAGAPMTGFRGRSVAALPKELLEAMFGDRE